MPGPRQERPPPRPLRGEVVQQDQVGPRVEDLADLLQRVGLHLDRQVGEPLPYRLECLGDPAGGDHVVVLDERGVRERHPVVDTAAAAHGVLLQGAQTRCRLTGVAHLRAGALQCVGPRARGGRDAGEPAQEVERAALPGQQVTGAGGDAEELVAGLDAGAVLDVPLDLEVLRTDDGQDGLGDTQSGDRAALAGREVAGGDGVGGNGRHARHVQAVVEILTDGDVGDVLDLDGVESGLGQQLGERGVETALQGFLTVRTAAAVAAAPRGGRRGADLDERYVHGLGARTVFGRAHGDGSLGTERSTGIAAGNSGVSVRLSSRTRPVPRRTTRWRRQSVSSRSGKSSRQ